MRKALATVVIGDRYVNEWNSLFRPSWEKYAARHGYQIVAITEPVDPTPRARERSFNWQKLLILEHPATAGFDQVVWLDTDIMINADHAPCIVDQGGGDKVGLVSNKQWLYSNPERNANIVGRAMALYGNTDSLADRYALAGLPADVDDYANTGVMVLRPDHRQVLRHVYDHYEESRFTTKEETPLSYHLFKHDLVRPIDPRFNRPWIYEVLESYPWLMQNGVRFHPMAGRLLITLCATTALHNTWFLHFTGEGVVRGDKHYSLRGDAALVHDCTDIMGAFSIS